MAERSRSASEAKASRNCRGRQPVNGRKEDWHETATSVDRDGLRARDARAAEKVPLTPEQIAALAAGGASETLEFKRTTRYRREAAISLCAFLNREGGGVLFGVAPDGTVAGQNMGKRTMEELSGEFGRIDPPAYPTFERVRVGGDREAILVNVAPGSAGPYRYAGIAYRRVGNANRAMSAEECNDLLFERARDERQWETLPAAGWSLEDLDEAEIRRTVEKAVQLGRLPEPGTREPADMLRCLELSKDGELLRAAAILFGRPERLELEMPQCRLRVARFRGVNRKRFPDSRQYRENAFALLARAELELTNAPLIGAERDDRKDEPLYPRPAVREAMANALCHRDYSIGGGSASIAIYDNRLEVTSSGALRFGLTPYRLSVPHDSLPWNPLIARTFYRRGVIEQRGNGTLRMAEDVAAAGLPRMEIREKGGCVTVRFRNGEPSSRNPRSLIVKPDAVQQAILDVLKEADGPLSRRKIHARLETPIDDAQLLYGLSQLRSRGLAMLEGRGRGAGWRLP